jgi:phosphonate degradation associated HDIG domain protein
MNQAMKPDRGSSSSSTSGGSIDTSRSGSGGSIDTSGGGSAGSSSGHSAHINTAGLSIADIVKLFAKRGHEQYDGEPVTQLQHALQTALLAEKAGADCELIVACLLHDLGHLLHDFGPTPTNTGLDDVHQYRVLPFLRPLFGPGVLDPIKLHVDAKRYLCATEAGYYHTLSADSVRSLELQGGVFNAEQVDEFIRHPHAAQAVMLRRWDDKAKRADWVTPDLDWFSKYLNQAANRRQINLQNQAANAAKTRAD